MAGTLSIVALVASALLLGTMVVALILLRKGEGPTYSASREYEANRRDALRALTGESVEALPGGQWYDPALEDPRAGKPLEERYLEAARAAVEAVAPAGTDLVFDERGRVRLRAEEAWRVVPAVSTAALRKALEEAPEPGPVAGLVLFNPEPPGGEATRVTLPVQALFGALERAGRSDLVRRFEALREEAPGRIPTLPGGTRA